MQFSGFRQAADETIKDINTFARKHSLVGLVRADHIGYKCDSHDSFVARRALLEPELNYFHQALISGRQIAYLRLKNGLGSSLGMINYVELSDQKPDGSQKDGFDHVEVYPTVGTYDELLFRLQRGGEKILKVERPHHTTHDIKLPSGFIIRLCSEPLIEKIKREEMQ